MEQLPVDFSPDADYLCGGFAGWVIAHSWSKSCVRVSTPRAVHESGVAWMPLTVAEIATGWSQQPQKRIGCLVDERTSTTRLLENRSVRFRSHQPQGQVAALTVMTAGHPIRRRTNVRQVPHSYLQARWMAADLS